MTNATRWQRKKDVRPGEILDAALKQFVEKGFRATKLEDIARAAGVTKGTPYLYFANKEEIFKAVVRETQVANLSKLQALSEQYDGSARALLFAFVEQWWQEVGATSSGGLCKLIMAETASFPELAQFYFTEVILPARQMVAQVLQRGIAQGEFRAVPIDTTVETLLAPLIQQLIWTHSFGTVPGCHSAGGHDPLRMLLDGLDLMLHGLLPRD
ncbi:TetR/AcrR family transcriptional regulator [Neisseriaceae bacterium JH1-16]|nr:TetR/AcrR family transcriptional regulator [Neisseriaceae bacterium JH1-16]